MTGNAKNQPAGGSSPSRPSKNASKAARREEMRQQLAREQAKTRRQGQIRLTVAIVIAAVVIAAVIVGVAKATSNSGGNDTASSPASSSVISAVTSIPASVVDAVGNGGGTLVKPSPLSGAPALTADGKPRVLYVGAEYCPFCAAERWAVVAALSRFGTFSNLGQTSSSSTDIYPNTATLSFHGASYTSKYISFTGVEQTDRNGKPLDPISPDDQKILDTYDTKQYVGSDGGIPFIAYGGKFVSSGATYDPGILKGLSHEQIASDLSDPNSPVTKAIVGSANIITSTVCQLTKQQPAAVCNAAGVRAAAS